MKNMYVEKDKYCDLENELRDEGHSEAELLTMKILRHVHNLDEIREIMEVSELGKWMLTGWQVGILKWRMSELDESEEEIEERKVFEKFCWALISGGYQQGYKEAQEETCSS